MNTGKYDTHDDFTVVVQPFMAHTKLPLKEGEIDYSYFAPDCFHFSGLLIFINFIIRYINNSR